MLVTLLLLSSAQSNTLAWPPDQILNKAIQKYHNAIDTQDHAIRLEQFRHSMRLFDRAIQKGQINNADLYTNSGNAALQADRHGEAILAYRRALMIKPGHRQAQQNLFYARQLLPNWVPRPPSRNLFDTFFFWHQLLSVGERTLLAAICFGMMACLVFVAIRWNHNWARNMAFLPFIVYIAFTGLSLWDQWNTTNNQAVITASQVVARSADSIGAPPRFVEPLPAGTEVEIIDQRESWARVRLGNGRDGWIRTSSFMLVSQ